MALAAPGCVLAGETCFLEYFVGVLRWLAARWEYTVACLTAPAQHLHAWKEDDSPLQRVMDVLVRTRLKLQRLHTAGLAPFNPSALIYRLQMVEQLHERSAAAAASTTAPG